MNLSFHDGSASHPTTNGRWDTMQTMMSMEQQEIPIPMDSSSAEDHIDAGKFLDFVLAYVDNGNLNHAERREMFEKDLKDQGLELEYEQNRQLCFVKIHAPQVFAAVSIGVVLTKIGFGRTLENRNTNNVLFCFDNKSRLLKF